MIFDVSTFSQKHICLEGHFWKYEPPGRAAGDKSRVSGKQDVCKQSSLKTVWLISFNDFLKPVSTNLSVALSGGGKPWVNKPWVMECSFDPIGGPFLKN